MIRLTNTINGIPRHRMEFDNLLEVVSFIQSTPLVWRTKNGASTNKLRSQSWDFNADLPKALELARDGWPEGVRDLDAALSVVPPLKDREDAWRYDVGGERPDIGRYLSGDPACMMRHGHPKGNKPIITLVSNIWISCGISGKQLLNYGAALTRIIDQLEQTSHRVELKAGLLAPHFTKKVTISTIWTVKKADDPVDLSALAFSLSHPAAKRRIGWSLWERSDAPVDDCYGIGVGRALTTDDLIDPAPNTLLLRGLRADTSACRTIESAIEYVRQQINEAAGEELVTVE